MTLWPSRWWARPLRVLCRAGLVVVVALAAYALVRWRVRADLADPARWVVDAEIARGMWH